MSDVEKYWDALRKSFGETKSWNELDPQLQSIFIQSINMVLFVLNHGGKNDGT